MKYLCLVYGEEGALGNVDDLHCLEYDRSIRESGHCVASEALQPVATATTVRVSAPAIKPAGPPSPRAASKTNANGRARRSARAVLTPRRARSDAPYQIAIVTFA